MATYYNPAEMSWEGLKDAFVKERYKQETANGWAHKIPPICGTQNPPVQAMGGGVVPNIEFTYLCASSSQTIMNPIDYCTMQLRLQANPSRSHAVCLVRFKAKAQLYTDSDAVTDIYTIIGTSSTNKVFTDAYTIISPIQYYNPTDDNVSITEINWNDNSITSRVSSSNYLRYDSVIHWSQPVTYTNSGYYMDSDATVNAWITNTKATDESATEWRRLQQHSASKTGDYGHYCFTNNPSSRFYIYRNYFPSWACDVPSASSGYLYLMALSKLPDDIPLFDLNDGAEKIIAYLDRGDDSGRIDPFTPPYPEVTEIEDYKTNQKLYISQNSKTNNKYSFEFLNEDYNKLDQINRDQYACYVYYNHLNDVKKTSQPAPVVTVNEDITTANDDYIAVSYLGWVDQTAEDAQTSGAFKVWYKYRKDSNVGIVVNKVEWLEHPWEAGGVVCPRTILESGEQVYTSPVTGETLTIIYRAITMDDIKADFTDEDDNEDDTTGSDVTIPTGRGIGTYLISESQLTAINAKLWSYDWAQFFKSSSINPVQCVISCKSIPFAAEGVGSEEIVIANMFTDVNASRVNPSFRSGSAAVLSVTMPSYNGDFTDIEHVRVHCYLPFIGWVDLPASEVISRRAKLDVGLSANTKILTFRYLADLIDGTCTCVIAVNGTERWKFDGVCGVDIPVTSDNHTNAINNAMHAGLQTVLSLGSAVVGGLTGNGMMSAGGVVSAISNVPNAIPTYSYSASASPSGYINAAMNTHIMLVIERPNVKYDANTVRRLGKPCHKVLPLGTLRGFTKCGSVRLEGIDATPEELGMIAAGLERGVIL